MTTITDFTKAKKDAGSNRVYFNASRNGVPFGQIWTWEAKDESHPFHALALHGPYGTFDSLADAMFFLADA